MILSAAAVSLPMASAILVQASGGALRPRLHRAEAHRAIGVAVNLFPKGFNLAPDTTHGPAIRLHHHGGLHERAERGALVEDRSRRLAARRSAGQPWSRASAGGRQRPDTVLLRWLRLKVDLPRQLFVTNECGEVLEAIARAVNVARQLGDEAGSPDRALKTTG